MAGRRSAWFVGVLLAAALISVSLTNWILQKKMGRQIAASDARIDQLRDQLALTLLTVGKANAGRRLTSDGDISVDDIKREIQSEMGLLPVRMLRKLRESFVELNMKDNLGKQTYGTAGYLGKGYFITVKHAVVPLDDDEEGGDRRITSIKIRYKTDQLPARVVDSGSAHSEVSPGDWAIIKLAREVDLPPLRIDTRYAYAFADPIFRMGNDYSKGIILSTGYVGQQMSNGLVTCLTDGHPGVSGGGVLDQQGSLVGIPIGRMDGDYRFSFILPLREEMFRKVPGLTLNLQ